MDFVRLSKPVNGKMLNIGDKYMNRKLRDELKT